ncbi:MAG: PAS-domain containing protein [Pseudomonadota bacterium]
MSAQSSRPAADQELPSLKIDVPSSESTAIPPADEMNAILVGADVGLALFDRELKLVSCNQLYRDLCGYRSEETQPGTHLGSLMRISLDRQLMPEDEIQSTIDKSLGRLDPGSSYAFQYSSPSARALTVRRRRLARGSVVETVAETKHGPETVGVESQFTHIAEAARMRMMHALDVMADGFALFDAQDRLVVYNRKFVDLNPKVADLILPGESYERLLRESIERGGYRLNDVPADVYYSQRLYRHRNPTEPVEAQLSDGRWIMINEKRTADGGVVKTRSDITELKHREFDLLRISKKLHSKNVHFDSALNNMIQGLCMFDKDQTLIVCNRRYLEIYGFSGEIVKPGIKLREIMAYSISLGNYTEEEADRALNERRDPSALSQRAVIKQRLKDGRIIAVMNEPMADGGTIATYQDITESELHAEQTADYLNRLERSNRELQEFAYVASHDLQEPLRKIEAFGDRLVRRYGEQLPTEANTYVDRMQNAAGRMRSLINDLLSYSRVATNANPFKELALNDVLDGVLSDLQIRIDEVQATVNCDGLPNIEADATQMRQLLQNLLSNALKFRKPDVAPVITIAAKRDVDPDDIQAREFVTLTLSDNGIGFDNQYKDQIFAIFQRLHGRLEYEGTGVGLATVRKIIERHGGTIDANGVPGEGATFIVRLPAKQSAAE